MQRKNDTAFGWLTIDADSSGGFARQRTFGAGDYPMDAHVVETGRLGTEPISSTPAGYLADVIVVAGVLLLCQPSVAHVARGRVTR